MTTGSSSFDGDNPCRCGAPDGEIITVLFCPGISVDDASLFPEQRIVDASVMPRPLGDVHPVDASEVLRELVALTGNV